jgi:hypothetical protein
MKNETGQDATSCNETNTRAGEEATWPDPGEVVSVGKWQLSRHAALRMCHRAVRQDDLDLVLSWGRSWRQGDGRTVHVIGHRDVRRALREGIDLRNARHVATVVADDGVIVTVIRTGDLRRLRRVSFKKGQNSRRAGGDQ